MQCANGLFGNRFEPNGLPDAACGLIAEPLAVFWHDLFANGLGLLFGCIPTADCKLVIVPI